MAQLVKPLPQKLENLSLDIQHPYKKTWDSLCNPG